MVNINLVFNIHSIEELGQVYNALKETATLQAKLALEKQIRELSQDKKRLEKEIKDLKRERDKLAPETKESGLDKKSSADEEEVEAEPYPDEEATEEAEEPSSLRGDGVEIIERLIEGSEDVDVSPGPPE